MSEKPTAISIEAISKLYSIGPSKDGSLRGTLSNLFKSTAKGDDFWALKDISFDVKKGDVVGIIGKNGAGKSTLLKILSQITRPSSGSIEINGRVASLLEVGTGFHPELTGRENIYLNGTILGMSRQEVKAKFDEIVAFSGIDKFIDTPVKHYSSGMYVRLAFSVAAHLEPEILIIDEVLAVGDVEFQRKCLGKMKDVSSRGRTILFVSHNMAAVQNLCDKAVVMDGGRMQFHGATEEAISYYLKSNISKIKIPLNERTDRVTKNNFVFSSAHIVDHNEAQIGKIKTGMDCSLKLGYSLNEPLDIIGVRLLIKDEKGITRILCNPALKNITPRSFESTDSGYITFSFHKFPLPKGVFHIQISAYSSDGVEDDIDHAFQFEVEGGDYYNSGREADVKDGVLVDFNVTCS